jgi:hypothetical protein
MRSKANGLEYNVRFPKLPAPHEDHIMRDLAMASRDMATML